MKAEKFEVNKHPRLTNGCSARGADMGRSHKLPMHNSKVKLYLRPLRMVDGDYDAGGAYWGGGPCPEGRMWCGFNNQDTVQVFVRANRRKEAKEKIISVFPKADFWR